MALDAAQSPVRPTPAELPGLAPQPGADGVPQLRLGELVLNDLGFKLGPLAMHVDRVLVRAPKVVLSPLDGSPVPGLHELQAEEAVLEGVVLQSSGGLGELQLPPGPWKLDALGGLDGALHAFVTDAAWIVDADVTLPIDDGRIDFNRVTVAHIGPDSTMGISHMGIYVDAPNGRNYLYQFAVTQVPGARFEQRGSLFGSRASDRGSLSLQAFLECMLRNASTRPIGSAPHQAGSHLDRTRLRGELQLGDGVLGVGGQKLALTGRAEGHNKLGLSATVLSDSLLVRLASLSAADASLTAAGWCAEAAQISGDATMRISGLGMPGRAREKPTRLMLELHRLRVGGLRLSRA